MLFYTILHSHLPMVYIKNHIHVQHIVGAIVSPFPKLLYPHIPQLHVKLLLSSWIQIRNL